MQRSAARHVLVVDVDALLEQQTQTLVRTATETHDWNTDICVAHFTQAQLFGENIPAFVSWQRWRFD